MGFLCKTKQNKYLDNPFYRDLGLSNIYNIKSDTNFCFESFEGPTYWLSGATKAITGTTTPCSGTPTNCYAVYNFSEIDDFNLKFNFTGSTQYSAYTGEFCYRIYGRKDYVINNANKSLRNVTPSFEKCTAFSAITASTIDNIIGLGSLQNTNNDYMVRSYYKLNLKECSKNTVNTWKTSTQLNNFNFDWDWYFTTVTNPEPPTIVEIPSEELTKVSMVQETVLGKNYNNYFNLNNFPIGGNEINLYVNGVRLSQGLDYSVDTSMYPRATPIINIFSANIESTDVITIVYLVGPQSFITALGQFKNELFNIDTFKVTGFTTNVTASTVNIVNDNTIKGTQEVFLTSDFDEQSTVVTVLNGVKLFDGIEFFKSSTTPNKIIFNPNYVTIKVGDILSFWYFKTKLDVYNDIGTLDKNSVTIRWTQQPIREPVYNTGIFTLEVTEKSDTTWSSLFYTENVKYNENSSTYQSTVTDLLVNKDYKFRIIFKKYYKNILNENIITSSNVIGYFNTKNDKIIYGY